LTEQAITDSQSNTSKLKHKYFTRILQALKLLR